MSKYLIKHNRQNCIGCGACASICPDFWQMANDNKSQLKGGQKKSNGTYELEIEEKDFACNQQAADACPVKVINVVKK